MKKFGIITTKDIPELQFIAEKLRKSFISPFTTPIKEVDTLAFSIAIATKEDGYCYNALKDEGFIK